MVEILRTKIKDIPQVLNVYEEVWVDSYVNDDIGITEEIIRNWYNKKSLNERISNFEYRLINELNNFNFVAKDNGRVVGVANAIQTGEDSKYNFLNSLYILPKYQGKGIGKMFMNEFLKVLGQKKPIQLQVASYNNGAKRFYEKYGFMFTGKIDKYYLNKTVFIPVEDMVLSFI